MHRVMVRNPKATFPVARIHPRQGLVVDMAYPHDRAVGEEWVVDVRSPYLALLASTSEPFSRKFLVDQIYDLKVWARSSQVYLGEVVVSWMGRPREGVAGQQSIGVFLAGARIGSRPVVTVINPADAVVRLNPHEILEVIVFDPAHYHRSFVHRIDHLRPLNQDRLNLVAGHKESVTYRVDDSGQFDLVAGSASRQIRSVGKLPINPRTTLPYNNPPALRGTYHASHFMYSLDPDRIKAVHGLKDGVYESSVIEYYADHGTDDGPEYSLTVQMNVRALWKRHLPAVPKPVQIGFDPQLVAAGNRLYDIDRMAMANPSDFETVEWPEGKAGPFFVDLVPPGDGRRWAVKVSRVSSIDETHGTTKWEERLTVGQELIEGHDGSPIQRFVVRPHMTSLGPNQNIRLKLIGLVHIYEQGNAQNSRTVNFSLVRRVAASSKTPPFRHTTTHYSPPPVPPPTPVFTRAVLKTTSGEISSLHVKVRACDITRDADKKKEDAPGTALA